MPRICVMFDESEPLASERFSQLAAGMGALIKLEMLSLTFLPLFFRESQGRQEYVISSS